MSETLKKAESLKAFMTEARRHFHQYPELAHKEFETTKYIKNALKEMGVPLLDAEFNTGCIGIIKGEGKGPDVITGIRADIDALPIIESTGLPYSSKNEGIMHACGHDGHTACLLGVAKLLSESKNKFSGTAMLIFQPAEEGDRGAKMMLENGAFTKHKPDEVIALHAFPAVETGKVGIMPIKAMASADSFRVKVIGRGGHGARPSESINPITAATSMISAISGIVSNQIPTFESVVISVCTIHAGVASNVIPQEVEFSGTVRCLENGNREIVKEFIERIVSGSCETFGCKYEYIYKEGIAALTNSKITNDKVYQAAKDTIGEENIVVLENATMGSEDFSDFIMAADGVGSMFRLGMGNAQKTTPALHNHLYDFNDEALPVGCAVLCQYVFNKHNA